MSDLLTRALNPADADAFRTLRLETLISYGEVFAKYYENMVERPADFWAEFCTETPDKCLFGLFDAGRLVGVMGVEKWERDKKERTALWTYAYLQPAYRGQKNAQSLYAAREDWTKNKGGYKRAVLSILEERGRSIDIHAKNGARFLFAESLQWYDGPAATWHWYEKIL